MIRGTKLGIDVLGDVLELLLLGLVLILQGLHARRDLPDA